MTTFVSADEEGLVRAEQTLRAGGLVAIPTETVYGLAANATDGAAVARIFEAKGRPRFNPLICHVSDLDMARRFGVFDPLSEKLTQAFWPGPLTLVVPLHANSGIHPLATVGLSTVGLRAPKGFAHRLIARLGTPLAAPSANASGRISPTTAQAVRDSLGNAVDLVVDGGPCPVGVESTILSVEGDKVRLLRPGGLSAAEIEAVTGVPLLRGSNASANAPEAPGMLVSHYAPVAAVRLVADRVFPGEALLAFGPQAPEGAEMARARINLSPTGDLREAAMRLFGSLAELDRSDAATIAVQPIPQTGLGEAINDRLRRAAAPRGAEQ